MSFNDKIDTLLTALASDDADAVERALQIYDVNDIVAVMAKRLLDAEGGGGGGGSIPSGSGTPVASVTPTGIGALYIDADTGALYIAVDTVDTAWIQVGGATDDTTGGFSVGGSDPGTANAIGSTVVLSDPLAEEGSGNGVYWNGNGADEMQNLQVVTGDGGITTTLADPAGTLTAGPGGIIFPTSDPGVAGAWWDDAGTLTKSSG